MANDFINRRAYELATLTNMMAEILQSAEGYGVSEDQVAELAAAGESLTAAMQEQLAALTTAQAATKAKRSKKEEAAAILAGIARTVYANPAVTDEMLFAIGLARRPLPTWRHNRPFLIDRLTAEPFADGSVKLKWDRGENGKRTMFLIEALSDDGVWRFVHSTTRCAYVAHGFEPGKTAWFRVTAATSTKRTAPSSPVAIYETGIGATLRAA